MKRRNKFKTIIMTAAIGLGLFALPAQAHTPLVLNCQGTATVDTGDAGLTVTADKSFDWDITVGCTWRAGTATGTATLTAEGEDAFGRCGRSTASGGTGTIDFGDHTATLTGVGWQSVGTVLVVTGGHDDGGQGELAAEVQATGDECATGDSSFAVTIVGQAV